MSAQTTFTAFTSVDDARADLLDGIDRPGGTTCLVCGQHAERYRFSLGPKSAREVAKLVGLGRPAHTKEWTRGSPAVWVMAGFGLVRRAGNRTAPFKKCGTYEATDLARRWVAGEVEIPRYFFSFNNTIDRVSAETWTFAEAVGGNWLPEDARQNTTPGRSQ